MITKNCVIETKVSSLKVWPSVFLRFGFSLLPLIQRLTLINCIFDHFFFTPRQHPNIPYHNGRPGI